MNSLYDTLLGRNLIAQSTNEARIRELLDSESVVFYIGFDATSDSLHLGHLIQFNVIKQMLDAGHKPICLIGGATTLIGDPTGKIEMRQIKKKDEVEELSNKLSLQISNFFNGRVTIVNNKDWLCELNYIDFLREVGVHFSVNKMLTAECFKTRMENGLSFIEFNYMLMQGYDFFYLNQKYNCKMEFGGSEQWANILGGVELIRRKTGQETFGLTFNLLTNFEGKKMGKTEKGALWLDPIKTSPFEFYQYFINVDDKDVTKFFKMLTFLPLLEIEKYEKLTGKDIKIAKQKLAFLTTEIVHGTKEAENCHKLTEEMYSLANFNQTPSIYVNLEKEITLLELLLISRIAPTKNEARRLVVQGGISINGLKIENPNQQIKKDDFQKDMIIKKGKKKFFKVKLGKN